MGKPIKNEDGTITIHAIFYSDGENPYTIKFAIIKKDVKLIIKVNYIRGDKNWKKFLIFQRMYIN